MIDQRALDKATAALAGYIRANPPRQFQNKYTGQVDAIISGMHARACIEAYEAALWRPIEEAPRDGTEIWVHWPKDGPSAMSGNWLTRWYHEGCWGQGDGALMPNSPLLKGAMFRTIEPPMVAQSARKGPQGGGAP